MYLTSYFIHFSSVIKYFKLLLLSSYLLAALYSNNLKANDHIGSPKVYQSSFESKDDFSGSYIVPQNHKNSASHKKSPENVRSGSYAHKGWIYKKNPPSHFFKNNNHRGYPTVQLYKMHHGTFKTPTSVEFWVWLDMDIQKGEWFSFATLDYTKSNRWDPVLVNLSDEGFVHLMHVPQNGVGKHTFQTTTLKFPMRQWVKLSILIYFDQNNGYAQVWQNDQLVSSAEVRRGDGELTQAHFGLYAPPSISKGVVFNYDLIIKEVNGR